MEKNRRRTCPWHDLLYYPICLCEIQYPRLRPSRLSPEMFLLIAMGAYAFVRRISSGIDIRDMLEKKIAG